MKVRIGSSAVLLLVGLFWLAHPQAVRAQSCSGANFVEQRFPLTGAEETRWRICWQNLVKNGLVITSAHFRKSPSAPFMRLFWDARISEIFVPYHPGSPRFYDITGFTFSLVPFNANHCPGSAGGTLLGSPTVVCKEVHDRGLAWTDDTRVRRGQELVYA